MRSQLYPQKKKCGILYNHVHTNYLYASGQRETMRFFATNIVTTHVNQGHYFILNTLYQAHNVII